VNRETIREFGRRSGDKIATIDLDATGIESWKREAQPTYPGGAGYQPMPALWAEPNAIVADGFRDGNVGAHTRLLPVAKQALAALPATVEEKRFRGDSACYEQDPMRRLRDRKRTEGPEGCIGFGIGAKMSDALRERLWMLPEGLWKPDREEAEADWEYAEPQNGDPLEKAGEEPDPIRYPAIRIRKKQGEPFADAKLYKYCAVAANRWDYDAKRPREWRREKAGAIEAAHEVLQNELAAGVMPCGRWGANAARLRLPVPTCNPPSARPKRLRFPIFSTAGRIVHRARSAICRRKHLGQTAGGWRTVLAALRLPQPARVWDSLRTDYGSTFLEGEPEVRPHEGFLRLPSFLPALIRHSSPSARIAIRSQPPSPNASAPRRLFPAGRIVLTHGSRAGRDSQVRVLQPGRRGTKMGVAAGTGIPGEIRGVVHDRSGHNEG